MTASNMDFNKSWSFQLCWSSQSTWEMGGGGGVLDHANRHVGDHFWVKWVKNKMVVSIMGWLNSVVMKQLIGKYLTLIC